MSNLSYLAGNINGWWTPGDGLVLFGRASAGMRALRSLANDCVYRRSMSHRNASLYGRI